MAKIHTHYDNLKVARQAPREVIRAAYKALSQKYHPDKNPGDEKAARIMALLNTAYGTLDDPQSRKEHDDWIAAEEWEADWTQGGRREERRGKRPAEAGSAPRHKKKPARAQPAWRGWKLWCGMAACFGLGGLGGVLMQSKLALVPAHPEAAAAIRTMPKAEPAVLARAAFEPAALAVVAAPEVRIAAVSQVVLPAAPPVCDETPALTAPNGEAWPQRSGPVAGFPFDNKGADMRVTVDNRGNAWPVLVKLYDLERRTNVRYLFILAHDKLIVDQLAFGKYEVRYQKINAGGSAVDGCDGARSAAL
jgi:hypothetical protein